MFEWAYSGANKAVPRNVGPECAYFLSHHRQIIETVIVTTVCIYILVSINSKNINILFFSVNWLVKLLNYRNRYNKGSSILEYYLCVFNNFYHRLL